VSPKAGTCSKCHRPLLGTWCQFCVSVRAAASLGQDVNQLLIPEAIALFDVDSTLADFEKSLHEGMMSLAAPGEAKPIWGYHEQDNEPEYITNRRRVLKKIPGFWRNLPKYQPGFDILDMVMLLGWDITILTKAPRKNHPAWTEKVEWCHANLPMDYSVDGEQKQIKVNIVEEKELVYGRLLVDDNPDYVLPWLKRWPESLVVMPAHGHNKDFRHPNVVRYESVDDKPKVYGAIKAQRLGQWKPALAA
jgi:5'-nucleotidase